MRQGVRTTLRGIAQHDLAFDMNGDALVNNADLRLVVSAFRTTLAPNCGNGVKETGESCDDANNGSGDGCSGTCGIELGFTCTGTAPSVCVNLPADLQAYWKFDEEGGTRFEAAGRDNLTVWNANIGSAEGKIGHALSPNVFYGLSAISPTLGNANRNFTVAAWVYFNPISLGNDSFVIADGVGGSWTWMLAYRFKDADRFNFSINNNGTAEFAEANNFGGVRKGEWNLVVASFDVASKVMSISVNAGPSDTHVFTGTPPSNASSISVGFDSYGIWGGSQHASEIARVDELGIWGRTLLQKDIVELYNHGDGQTTPFRNTICGNGVASPDEPCDDGNSSNTDACTNECKKAKCGDHFTQGAEQCDDGNQSNTDDCTNACKLPVCGDTFVQAGEECDDGNSATGDACPKNCKNAVCGDGSMYIGHEQCDDGNRIDDDGCSNACILVAMTQERCLRDLNNLWDSAAGCIPKTRCYEYTTQISCPKTGTDGKRIPSNLKPCKWNPSAQHNFQCEDDMSQIGGTTNLTCAQMSESVCGGADKNGNFCLWNGTHCAQAPYFDRCVGTRDPSVCQHNDLCRLGKERTSSQYISYPFCAEKYSCNSIHTQENCTEGLRANVTEHCLWDPKYERDYGGVMQARCVQVNSDRTCQYHFGQPFGCLDGKKGNYFCRYDETDQMCRIDHPKSGSCVQVNSIPEGYEGEHAARCRVFIGCVFNAASGLCENEDPSIPPPPG